MQNWLWCRVEITSLSTSPQTHTHPTGPNQTWEIWRFSMNRVPTGSGKQGKQGENNGQGKVRAFYFGPKVREKSGNFVLICRLPWQFAVILVDYQECLSRYSPMWKCTRIFVFFIVFKCYISSIKYNTDIIWNELFQTPGFVWYIYIQYSSTISCR